MGFDDLIKIAEAAFKKKFKEADKPFIYAKDEKPVNGLVLDCPLLEYLFDRRYIPYGRFYLCYGKKGSSKTSFFYDLAKIVQAQQGDVAWMETERAADLVYAAKQGVDLSKLSLSHPESLEQALTLGEELVRGMPKAYPDGNTPVLVCLDSIAGSVTEYEQESKHSILDASIGQHARILSRWYREMQNPLANEKCIFLCLNQLKASIGGMPTFGEEPPEAMIGGFAPGFHSTYQLKFDRTRDLVAEDEYGAERKVGARIKITCKRNKLGRDGNKQFIIGDLYEHGGYDWWGPLVRKLKEEYTPLVGDGGSGWYLWKTEGMTYKEPASGEEIPIDTEQKFRESELGFIIKNSVPAKELIRKAFGIPDMPAQEILDQVEAERKVKRKKKKKEEEEGGEKAKAVL